MIIITKISIVVCAVLLLGGIVELTVWKQSSRQQQRVLDCALYMMQQEQIRASEIRAMEEKEEQEQKTKVFYMDFKIVHCSAFGGFCATMNDGRRKKGSISLEHIMLHARHPSAGREITYYIEDQNIEICAMDDPEELLVRSRGAKFEIRQDGQGRDEGTLLQSAVIRRDILYYIILESKHEISIKAVKGC